MSKTVHPGGEVLVELRLQSRARTPVDVVELHLDGTRVTRAGSAYQALSFLALVARVAERVTLEEGAHRYRASFPLPASAPCSYVGALAEIRYAIRLSVGIPWWFDVQESYEVNVAPRAAPRPPRAPVASTTQRGDEPFVEVSLDDQAFAAADEISGAVALGNVHGRKVRGVELSLVGHERVGADKPAEARRYTAFRRADARDEGRELPFRFRVPAGVPPSFDAGWAALTWALEVRVDLSRANDVVHTTPLVIGAFHGPAEAPAMRRQIGSGRWRAVWGSVGARHRLSLDPLELRLRGALSGCAAAVWIDAGGAAGGALAGELRWPSWGLDLQIGLKRFMLSLLAEDDEGFGNRYRVRGREPGQVLAVVAAPLRRALLAFDEVRLDDAHATVLSRTPGHDQPWLGTFLDRLAALAAEIAAASQRIPPPAAMAELRPAWEAYAREVHGRFEVGRMCIRDAHLDGATFHVETCFERSPEPDRTEVTLVVDPPLESPFDPDDPEQAQRASPAVREIVAGLRAGARALRVAQDALVLTLPAPLESPAALRDPLATLLALAQKLRGVRGAGPYR